MDDPVFNYATLAMESTKRVPGPPITSGPDGNGWFDGFNDLSCIDQALCQNIDVSQVGIIRRGNEGAMNFIPPATDTTNGNVGTYVCRDHQLPNGETINAISHYLPFAASTKIKIFKRIALNSFECVFGQPVSHPGGGVASFPVTFAVPATGDYFPGVYWAPPATGNGRLTGRLRAAISAVDVVTTATMSEDTGIAPSMGFSYGAPDEMVVQSTLIDVTGQPDWGRLVLFASATTADFTARMSRDGADFVDLTMTKKYTRRDGSAVFDSGVVDLSGLAAGTTGRWKIETENNPAAFGLLAAGVFYGAGQP